MRTMGRRNLKRDRLTVSRLDTSFSPLAAGGDSGSSISGRGWVAMRSSHFCLMHREILVVARSRYTQRSSQLQFREIVIVQAGNVLVIRACQRLLSLHDFDAVRHPGGKTFLRTSQIFIGKVHVLARDRYLLVCRLQVKKSRTDVVIDLPAQVFRFCLALAKACFRFCDVALDASASENRYAHRRLEGERAVQAAKVRALHSVIAASGQYRIALCASC